MAEQYPVDPRGSILGCPGLERRILQLLRKHGWMSRADLVAELGIRPSRRTTVFEHLVRLEADGLVRRTIVRQPGPGRPFTLWGPVP